MMGRLNQEQRRLLYSFRLECRTIIWRGRWRLS
jgi:hypothetical protein